jgi:spore germination protein KA
MAGLWRGKKKQKNETKLNAPALADRLGDVIPRELDEVERRLKELFHNCSDVVFRDIVSPQRSRAFLLYVDGMVETNWIQDHALYPLLFDESSPALDTAEDNTVSVAQITKESNFSKAVQGVLIGAAALFVEGRDQAILLNVRSGFRRNVSEPETEAAIRGPREGFTENLRCNTALVRFKVTTPDLKMERFIIGRRTSTNVVLSYIDGLADREVIELVRSRLKAIDIDAVLESSYIEELIEDERYSPFPTTQNTERPDTVAGGLLEGKFAIFIDGTPMVLLGPVSLWSFLQASEDYYQNYLASSMIRYLRYIFAHIALYTPALYIAVTTYHQDMLPTPLMLSIAAAREAIPFPALIEALIMEVSFEALREAGIRLPKIVGQAVSILGALVIGQAAVQAGIVSAPVVIIVSLTGIASFTIPRFNFAVAIRLLRFPFMVAAALFGVLGIIIGTMLILIHLCQVRSYGVPYLTGIAPIKPNQLKDLLFRVPWWAMKRRPEASADKVGGRRLNLDKPETGGTE